MTGWKTGARHTSTGSGKSWHIVVRAADSRPYGASRQNTSRPGAFARTFGAFQVPGQAAEGRSTNDSTRQEFHAPVKRSMQQSAKGGFIKGNAPLCPFFWVLFLWVQEKYQRSSVLWAGSGTALPRSRFGSFAAGSRSRAARKMPRRLRRRLFFRLRRSFAPLLTASGASRSRLAPSATVPKPCDCTETPFGTLSRLGFLLRSGLSHLLPGAQRFQITPRLWATRSKPYDCGKTRPGPRRDPSGFSLRSRLTPLPMTARALPILLGTFLVGARKVPPSYSKRGRIATGRKRPSQ